nr:hypothetical protein KV8917_180093 [Klebsiella variicola]
MSNEVIVFYNKIIIALCDCNIVIFNNTDMIFFIERKFIF